MGCSSSVWRSGAMHKNPSAIRCAIYTRKSTEEGLDQQFNTTSSLGRLTLNILLSFAEFERQIISERTRDKMSAARRKGKWVGGTPVLGYDVDPTGGRLIVNDKEAQRVREIFQLFKTHRSLLKV